MTTLSHFYKVLSLLKKKPTDIYPLTQVCLHCPCLGSGVLSHQQITMQGEYAGNLNVILLVRGHRLFFHEQ